MFPIYTNNSNDLSHSKAGSFTCYCVTLLMVLNAITVSSQASAKISRQEILVVLSSHKYGYWVKEMIEPYQVFEQNGFNVTFATPIAGQSTPQGISEINEEQVSLLNSNLMQEKLSSSIFLGDVDSSEYAAVFFVGGSGPMFDLVNNKEATKVIEEMIANNRPVAAVCHGPAVLIGVKNSDGSPWVSDKTLTAKTNLEENQWAKDNYPFFLEDVFNEIGSNFVSNVPWEGFSVVDGNLITGQNPNSAILVASDLVSLLVQNENHISGEKNAQ